MRSSLDNSLGLIRAPGVASMFVVLALLAASVSASQELPFTHYTQENELNPLPSAEVRAVYQDRLGYIWMVVYSSGLLQYNGHSFTFYSGDDGLPDLGVRTVFEDSLGRLWVASNSGLVVTEKPTAEYEVGSRYRFTQTIGGRTLLNTAIVQNRVAVDQMGRIWIGTRDDGIIRYSFPRRDSVAIDTIRTNFEGSGKNQDVRAIAVREDRSVYVAVGNGDILAFGHDSPHHDRLTEKEGAPRIATDVLFENANGILIGGCRNGLVWRLSKRDRVQRIEAINRRLTSPITAIVEAPVGTLWVACEGSGVMKISYMLGGPPHGFEADQMVVYTRRNGLLSNNVNNILHDREGNIWFAQIGGVSKLRRNYEAFGHYTSVSHGGERSFLTNQSVSSVIPRVKADPLPGIWIGTSGGIALIRDDGEVRSIEAEQGLRSNWVNGLAKDEKGRLWVGTTGGITCVSVASAARPPPSRVVRDLSLFGYQGVVANYRNTTIYACRNLRLPETQGGRSTVESIWFPGYQVLYCLIGDEWYAFYTASGLPASLFHSVSIDGEGYLWVGTQDAGLYKSTTSLSVTKLRELPKRKIEFQLGEGKGTFGHEITSQLFEPVWNRTTGAPSNQIETTAYKNGILWVGTPEGLAAVEGNPPQMTKFLTVRDGLKANHIGSLAFSPVTGSLWVGTNGGLVEVNVTEKTILRTITKQDGLVDNEVWYYGSVAVGPDGTVYFGTAKGLSLYKPHADKPNTNPPILRLHRAELFEDNISNNAITFEYAALSFVNERFVRYKTRLIGFDREWSDEKKDMTIRYTNLNAFFLSKKYTFEVVASNNEGVWTETPLAYSFSVLPPIWFRWYSIVVTVVLLLVSVNSFNRYRIRKLRKRSEELEHIVDLRTQEIRQKAEENLRQAEELAYKNRELEEKNQRIIETQEQLVVQEKLASLGALTAGIAHEIKNPLNFINNFAELSTELIEELREEMEKGKDRFNGDEITFFEETLGDLAHNAAKINEHGKRADSIVRGMLLHSRGKSGERLPTDINTLLDENATLAYHGLRAQDSSFNVTIKKEYDSSVGQLDVVPQDLSRVFLNIVNNACYAAHEKKKVAGGEFNPELLVCTKDLGDKVEIRIRDNGNGIPKEIVGRIFEPFFTTKPTGKGTGLGLSLSYDIVVKGHKGELQVDSKEGEFAEFIIRLPKNQK